MAPKARHGRLNDGAGNLVETNAFDAGELRAYLEALRDECEGASEYAVAVLDEMIADLFPA